ncbi:unnamed protein product [Hyaloperonospora brassicae]|nr:unnamed protein product [Hyaloperonospora brassicae]
MGFVTSPYVATCMSDVGSKLTPIMSELSLEEIKPYCDSDACVAFLAEIGAAGLGDCKIQEMNAHMQTDIVDAFNTKCKAVRSMETSNNATANNIRDGSSSSATSGTVTITVSYIATVTLITLTLLI